MANIKWVDYTELYENNLTDEENFVYAVCKCANAGEGIQIPRPDHTDYIKFKCPKCNEPLGIVAKGKYDTRMLAVV